MSFSEEKVQKVWEKAEPVAGNDPNVWRKDQCGAWIGRKLYGSRESEYGWEVDHISPKGAMIFPIFVHYNGRTILTRARDD